MRPAGSGREDTGLPRPRADAAPRRPVRGKWSVTAWTGPLLTAAVLGSAMILAPLPPPLSGVGNVAFAQNDDGPGNGEGGGRDRGNSDGARGRSDTGNSRSEEHTSELQSLMRHS